MSTPLIGPYSTGKNEWSGPKKTKLSKTNNCYPFRQKFGCKTFFAVAVALVALAAIWITGLSILIKFSPKDFNIVPITTAIPTTISNLSDSIYSILTTPLTTNATGAATTAATTALTNATSALTNATGAATTVATTALTNATSALTNATGAVNSALSSDYGLAHSCFDIVIFNILMFFSTCLTSCFILLLWISSRSSKIITDYDNPGMLGIFKELRSQGKSFWKALSMLKGNTAILRCMCSIIGLNLLFFFGMISNCELPVVKGDIILKTGLTGVYSLVTIILSVIALLYIFGSKNNKKESDIQREALEEMELAYMQTS